MGSLTTPPEWPPPPPPGAARKRPWPRGTPMSRRAVSSASASMPFRDHLGPDARGEVDERLQEAALDEAAVDLAHERDVELQVVGLDLDERLQARVARRPCRRWRCRSPGALSSLQDCWYGWRSSVGNALRDLQDDLLVPQSVASTSRTNPAPATSGSRERARRGVQEQLGSRAPGGPWPRPGPAPATAAPAPAGGRCARPARRAVPPPRKARRPVRG